MAKVEAKQPGPKFLGRFAAEVGALAGDLEAFQDVLCNALRSPDRLDAPERIQALDELSQRARALANVAAALAEANVLNTRAPEQLAMTVTLSDLARRLAGDTSEASKNEGELQLF